MIPSRYYCIVAGVAIMVNLNTLNGDFVYDDSHGDESKRRRLKVGPFVSGGPPITVATLVSLETKNPQTGFTVKR
uniref:Uncharacterized protein n=1 Tax=Parascaris equorum TaxID=6256 RepID=A0A914RHQ1_PAREQ